VGAPSQENRDEREAEGDVLDDERRHRPGAGEYPREPRPPDERGDDELGGRGGTRSLGQRDLQILAIAQRLEALARERLEAAMRMVQPRTGQKHRRGPVAAGIAASVSD